MNLKRVKIVDDNFAHAKFTTDHQISKHIIWDRTHNYDTNEIIFITDNSLYNVDRIIGKKIGLLMEPRAINSNIYSWMQDNHLKFKEVLTYDKKLLEIGGNIMFYPHSGCWIDPEEQLIHEKNKILSIIASKKNDTIGHKLRHKIISFFKELNIEVDTFGRGYTPIENKIEALKDYAFSIVIENSKIDYYFTEKLIDCFITGTIPIYWGCPSIGDFFNLNGMIIIDNLDDIYDFLKNITFEEYEKRLSAIIENYELAKNYLIAEDWIYKNTEIFK